MREIGARTERIETRYYLTSIGMARGGWAGSRPMKTMLDLHWVMDMTMTTSAVSGEHAPGFVTLKHMAANLARKAPGRDSRPALHLKTAAWDDDYLAKLIAA